jgi:hypothetical protein
MRKLRFAKPVPEGKYTAIFSGIEDTNHREFGDGLKWKFEILDGEHAGREITRITPVLPTAKNICGKLLRALTGCSDAGEVDIDGYRGTRVELLVGATADGNGTRVEAILPPSKPSSAPPTASKPENDIPF